MSCRAARASSQQQAKTCSSNAAPVCPCEDAVDVDAPHHLANHIGMQRGHGWQRAWYWISVASFAVSMASSCSSVHSGGASPAAQQRLCHRPCTEPDNRWRDAVPTLRLGARARVSAFHLETAFIAEHVEHAGVERITAAHLPRRRRRSARASSRSPGSSGAASSPRSCASPAGPSSRSRCPPAPTGWHRPATSAASFCVLC